MCASKKKEFVSYKDCSPFNRELQNEEKDGLVTSFPIALNPLWVSENRQLEFSTTTTHKQMP